MIIKLKLLINENRRALEGEDDDDELAEREKEELEQREKDRAENERKLKEE